MLRLRKTITLIMILQATHSSSIEHPQSYSLFKRGVVLGDMTYSYASTDMGSSNGGRVKTVTVIKNVSVPKPTSMVFSDRTEQFFDKFDQNGHKNHEHVQYWPADETNKMKKATIVPPSFTIPETEDFSIEEFKHPMELIDIVKSAAKTQNKLLKKLPSDDTGPVVFPADTQSMKKKNNGVVTVAKDYTSVSASDPKERSKPKTASKLSTKVETSAQENQPKSYGSTDTSDFYHDDFEQTEYVYFPEKNTYTLKSISKAPTAIKNKIKNTAYAYKDPSPPSKIDFTLYSTPNDTTVPDLLFSELANAVASRNISMIKSLAGQLDEPYVYPQFDFESLKTDEYGPLALAFKDKGKLDSPASTTVPKFDFVEASTATSPMTTTTLATTTTPKKLLPKYIAPRLRGFKRFSSRKQ
ncbi:uncharacterized protein LOC129723541 [Wyeomyia smithii]|uniref:uncharacterized protein LOC129723541 n=1 Tax=Wyeomyia smithii TaxID=174621 RepID=UPI0024681E4D|nr:uncharacterized protein LOC129723541 [Wyeomyia smithii]